MHPGCINKPKRFVLLLVLFSLPAAAQYIATRSVINLPLPGVFHTLFVILMLLSVIYLPALVAAKSICCGDYPSTEWYFIFMVLNIVIYAAIVYFILNMLDKEKKNTKK